MPEGPECKLYAEKLNYWLRGQELKSVELLSGRYTKTKPSGLDGMAFPAKLGCVMTKGKFIYFEFLRENGGNRFIWSTLGLTGSWHEFPNDNPRVKFNFTGEVPSIYFWDQRNFGTLHFNKSTDETFDKILGLGIDFLKGNSDFQETQEIFKLKKNQNKTLAEILMNQENYAGVGNYIKAEALYRAKLSPWRLGKDVAETEQRKLHQDIQDIMWGAYYTRKGEITLMEKYDGFRKVIYKQKISPCGNPIIHEETDDGRTTWWVPKVQK